MESSFMNDLYGLMALPLDGGTMLHESDANLIEYANLKYAPEVDAILSSAGSCIILYKQKPTYGHWTCILEHGPGLEFFDPYGLIIDKQLGFTDERLRKELGQTRPLLAKMFHDSMYDELEYNDFPFQAMMKGVYIATCGRHVLVRLALKNYSLEQYKKIMKVLAEHMFGDHKLKYDLLVTYLTQDVI